MSKHTYNKYIKCVDEMGGVKAIPLIRIFRPLLKVDQQLAYIINKLPNIHRIIPTRGLHRLNLWVESDHW